MKPRRQVVDVIDGMPGHYTLMLSCGHVKRINNRRTSYAQALPAPKTAACDECGKGLTACGVTVDAPTVQQAYDLGAKGAPATERERLLFEAWMRGHCWALCATWDGKQYRSDAEQGGDLDPRAMATRRLFAAWRDRAALGVAPSGDTDGR